MCIRDRSATLPILQSPCAGHCTATALTGRRRGSPIRGRDLLVAALPLPKHCDDLTSFSRTYAVFVPMGGWRDLTYGQGWTSQQVCPGFARDLLTEHEYEAGSMED